MITNESLPQPTGAVSSKRWLGNMPPLRKESRSVLLREYHFLETPCRVTRRLSKSRLHERERRITPPTDFEAVWNVLGEVNNRAHHRAVGRCGDDDGAHRGNDRPL